MPVGAGHWTPVGARAPHSHQLPTNDRRTTAVKGNSGWLLGSAYRAAIIIDCANPPALAEFYQNITGWRITHSDNDSAYLGESPIQLAFQRVDGYQGPQWPDDAKHAHLDFATADVEATIKELLALGATKPDFQPGGGDWTVLTDPEGHPFCIAAA